MKIKYCPICKREDDYQRTLIFIRENQWLCVKHGLIYGLYSDAPKTSMLTLFQHKCGNDLELRWTKGFNPMLKLFCVACGSFIRQFSDVQIKDDWLSLGSVMEIVIDIVREAKREKEEEKL